MAIKIPFPNWVDIKGEHLDAIDVGASVSPIKRPEWKSVGAFIRGPIVIESTPRTTEQYRSQFPGIYNFLRLDPDSNYEQLHAYIGEKPITFELQRVMYSTDEAIFFTAKNVGHLKIRRITKDDYPDDVDVDEYVKQYWGQP